MFFHFGYFGTPSKTPLEMLGLLIEIPKDSYEVFSHGVSNAFAASFEAYEKRLGTLVKNLAHSTNGKEYPPILERADRKTRKKLGNYPIF